MATPKKSAIEDYQQRATEFFVGDLVYPFLNGNSDLAGTVQAVWPAIGMVDVEWPHGSERVPVETLGRSTSKFIKGPEVGHDNVPGGAGTVSVPGGPKPSRVASAFVKKALYWAARDRRYRPSRGEQEGGQYTCPKCKDRTLLPATYKRRDGVSERLLACPSCLFLIKRDDIISPERDEDGDITVVVKTAKRPSSKEEFWAIIKKELKRKRLLQPEFVTVNHYLGENIQIEWHPYGRPYVYGRIWETGPESKPQVYFDLDRRHYRDPAKVIRKLEKLLRLPPQVGVY